MDPPPVIVVAPHLVVVTVDMGH